MHSAVQAMVTVERVVEPNMIVHQSYQRFYECYKQMYPALAPLLHRQVAYPHWST